MPWTWLMVSNAMVGNEGSLYEYEENRDFVNHMAN